MSTLDLANVRSRRIVCTQCGRPIEGSRYPDRIEFGLRILVVVVLTLLAAPLAVLAWKFCSDLASDHLSHSIVSHPLEDWSQF